MNVQQAQTHVEQTQIDLDDIMRQGGHRPGCAALGGRVNYDYSCNLCNAFKNHVQAMADLTAAETDSACSIPVGESEIN